MSLYLEPRYKEGVRTGCGWYKFSNLAEPFRNNKCVGCPWKGCCPAPSDLTTQAITKNIALAVRR